MAYTDFTIEALRRGLGLTVRPADVFAAGAGGPVPAWLSDLLARGLRQSLLSEKSRGEFLVAPILLALQETAGREIGIYSGVRLDADPAKGLMGECDFLLAAGPPLPELTAPLAVVLEAKRHDIESGVAQCVAQMAGARIFNERSARPTPAVFGAVTTGEAWRFLRLVGDAAELDRRRWFIDDVGGILAVLREMVISAVPTASAA
jgi:hypothetical protein